MSAASVQQRERGREVEAQREGERRWREEVEERQRRLRRSSSSFSSTSSTTLAQQQQQEQRRRETPLSASSSSGSNETRRREEDPLATLAGVDVSGSRLLLRAAPRRAALFAAAAHGGQLRRSGEPYVTHCVETAKIVEAILADFYQDGTGGSSSSSDASSSSAAASSAADAAAEAAVVAALLHDVPDDTPVPLSALNEEFGESVGGLVSAVSRLSRTYQLLRRRDSSSGSAAAAAAAKAEEQKQQKKQAPTLSATAISSPLKDEKAEAGEEEDEQEEQERERQRSEDELSASMSRAMVVASVDEPLCLVIKLADRLHNMRTAWALPLSKREAVARETLRTWCPLAGRLGLFALQAELEDCCFAVADPVSYAEVRATLDAAGSELPAVAPAVAAAGGGSGPRGPRGRVLSSARSSSFGGGGLLTLSPAPSSSTSTSSAATALAPPPPPPALLEPPPAPPSLPPLSLPEAPAAAHALGEDAARCASLLATVPSFDVTTFERPPGRGAGARRRAAAAATAAAALSSNSSPSSPSFPLPPGAAPRALGDLWAAAGLLLREIAVEAQATGLDVRVQGRLKSALSVSRKAKRKAQRPQDVLDARALRVVVTPPKEEELGGGSKSSGTRRNDGISLATPLATAATAKTSSPPLPSPSSPGEAAAVAACYRILPTVHRLWRPISGEADDYIVSPKPSGYRSLHTAVWGGGGFGGKRSRQSSSPSPSTSTSSSPNSSDSSPSFFRKISRDSGSPMEVQLRTGAMHAAAEHGAAAHWAYKETAPIRIASSKSSSTKSSNETASDAAAAALAAVAKVAATGAARIVAASSASSLDAVAVAPRLRRGDPLARVSGGKLQLGVVLRCSDGDEEGSGGGGNSSLPRRRSALVAVRVAPRLDPSAGPPPRAAVAALLEASERNGWDAPGRGGLGTKVEEFAPGGDGRWHRVDAYGRMLPAVVMPLVAEEEEEKEEEAKKEEGRASSALGSAAVAAPSLQRQNAAPSSSPPSSPPAAAKNASSTASSSPSSPSLSAAGDKIRLLRAMLQWTKDVEGGSGSGSAATTAAGGSGNNASLLAASPEDVLVLVWPPGDIARVPRGTTAGSLVASRRPQEEEKKKSGSKGSSELPRPRERATTGAPPATATLSLPSSSPSSLPPFPPVVNVNNRLVPPRTPLADGDFVVLDGGLLENL